MALLFISGAMMLLIVLLVVLGGVHARRREPLVVVEIQHWRGTLRAAHREGFLEERAIAASHLRALVIERKRLVRCARVARLFRREAA